MNKTWDILWSQVFALGFVSVFDQVLEGMPEKTEDIFEAYISALGEDSSQYRADADKLAELAKGLTASKDLLPDEGGNEVITVPAKPFCNPSNPS